MMAESVRKEWKNIYKKDVWGVKHPDENLI